MLNTLIDNKLYDAHKSRNVFRYIRERVWSKSFVRETARNLINLFDSLTVL